MSRSISLYATSAVFNLSPIFYFSYTGLTWQCSHHFFFFFLLYQNDSASFLSRSTVRNDKKKSAKFVYLQFSIIVISVWLYFDSVSILPSSCKVLTISLNSTYMGTGSYFNIPVRLFFFSWKCDCNTALVSHNSVCLGFFCFPVPCYSCYYLMLAVIFHFYPSILQIYRRGESIKYSTSCSAFQEKCYKLGGKSRKSNK